MINNSLRKKIIHLTEILKSYKSLAIALSGGIDSIFLLLYAERILGYSNVLAITAQSIIHFDCDLDDAIFTAKKIGVKHILFKSKEMYLNEFIVNNKDRCYFCKKGMLRDLKRIAVENNFIITAHGANIDDLNDYRPGFRAAHEFGIVAPLIEANFSKKDIRCMTKFYGVNFWNKPARSCLATRFPYGTRINFKHIEKVKKAELFLSDIGFDLCRVRHYGKIAKIEINISSIENILNENIRAKIIKTFKKIGYTYITLDLEGYRQGNMNLY